MVVAAGRDERRAGPVPHHQFEAEHAAVEPDRALEVRHFQMHVADVDARVDRTRRCRHG